jgi:hypothetical protein
MFIVKRQGFAVNFLRILFEEYEPQKKIAFVNYFNPFIPLF